MFQGQGDHPPQIGLYRAHGTMGADFDCSDKRMQNDAKNLRAQFFGISLNTAEQAGGQVDMAY